MSSRATCRLQFNAGFSFVDAIAVVPYLASLGISHLYTSPIAAARTGSTHGYDGIDPTRVDPTLGGEDGLRALVTALKAHGMGLIVDIVPNHMAAAAENAWWIDVLRHGRASRYADFFDIDWDREDGKVLLPVLGQPLDAVLEAGELLAGGDGMLHYHDHGFPLNRESDFDRQHYRLAYWRSAGDRINWRRFFEINDLVCLRQEDEAVFEATHALVLRLHTEGVVAGVRVDHIDGLTDPAGYCRKLRKCLGPDAYIVVEKILLGGETLPESWQCDGTTGYDFMDEVSALQHDPAGEAPLSEAWAALSGRSASFVPEEQAARREMLERSFGAPLDGCVDAFHRAASAGADLSAPAIRRALIELLAHFPVYRTYGDGSAADAAVLKQAGAAARATMRPGDHWVLDSVLRLMAAPASGDDHRRALVRFQQLSAPIAAKSVEDTAFYRYGRLLSRNDVGFDMARFADSPAAFHARMRRRQGTAPHSLVATATHDHKRGEDVRARLAVLSELAPQWIADLRRWLVLSAPLRPLAMPDDTDLVMLLQMIVGAWPLDLDARDEDGRAAFAVRLVAWQEKALRESKRRSDWLAPDEAYEAAARAFVTRLVGERAIPDLLEDIVRVVQRIAAAGAVNGLAQALLRLTVPGVPDLYQGTEFWDFSLVDPDNRRPVDYAARAAALDGMRLPVDLLDSWRDGRIKQAVIARALRLRQRLPDLFAHGSYEPLAANGPHSDHFVAFARHHEGHAVVVVVPRLPIALLAIPNALGLSARTLQGTSIALPDVGGRLADVFDPSCEIPAGGEEITLGGMGAFPLILLSTAR